MFGYVKPFKPDLRIREFEQYKAVYCSLCKSLKKNYGFLTGFTLNYDFVFMALMFLSLDNQGITLQKGRCRYNPLKSCNFCAGQPEAIDFSAGVAVLLTYYKLCDTISDSKGLKRMAAVIAKAFAKRPYKKAVREHPGIDTVMADYISAQNQVEAENSNDIDQAADPTATMLSRLCTVRLKNEERQPILERLGYCLGRWIYLIDAADDFEKDRKQHNYNVYVNNFGNDILTDEVKSEIEKTLNFCAVEAARMLFELPVDRHKPVLENILTDGLLYTQKLVLWQKGRKKETKL